MTTRVIMSCSICMFDALRFTISPKSTLTPSIRLQGQAMACCRSSAGPQPCTSLAAQQYLDACLKNALSQSDNCHKMTTSPLLVFYCFTFEMRKFWLDNLSVTLTTDWSSWTLFLYIWWHQGHFMVNIWTPLQNGVRINKHSINIPFTHVMWFYQL